MVTNFVNFFFFFFFFFDFADADGNPNDSYWQWAIEGWSNPKPIKHPLGAWRTPICHLWKGRKLNRLEVQNEIFVPAYAKLVTKTKAFEKLQNLYSKTDRDIILLDYEGFNRELLGLSWKEVLNHPTYPIGQGFVLCMLLEGVLDDAGNLLSST